MLRGFVRLDVNTPLSETLSSVSRWSEQLVIYPRTNKQNQKKKRKVEPTTSQVMLLILKSTVTAWFHFALFLFHCLFLTVWHVHVQEPGPAKVAVTGSGIPEADKVPDSSSIIWQEELNQREAEGAAVWAAADLPPGSPLLLPGTEE